MSTNNIKIDRLSAQILNGFFETKQGLVLIQIFKDANLRAMKKLQDTNRNLELFQGIARAFTEIGNMPETIKKELEILD